MVAPSAAGSAVPYKSSWSLHELLRVGLTVASTGMEMLVHNGLENLRHALGGSRTRTERQLLAATRLDGKVCVVTGANAGIGLSTCEALASMGAHVIMACRSRTRGEAARQRVMAAAAAQGAHVNGNTAPTSAKVELMELDLASLASVRNFVKAFNARKLPLHLLICNAGIMAPPEYGVTVDGHEQQFQVNFLSHWLLAHDLVEEQRRRRKGKGLQGLPGAGLSDDGVRVVILSSCTHTAGYLYWQDKQSQRHYSPFLSYAFSKLAALTTAKELQRRFDRNPGFGADVAVAVHPGVVDTHLANNFFSTQGEAYIGLLGGLQPLCMRVYNALVTACVTPCLRSVEAATGTVLHAALAPGQQVAGRYIVPPANVGRPEPTAEDEARAAQLWDLALQLTATTDVTLR